MGITERLLESSLFGSAILYAFLIFCFGLLFLAFVEGIAWILRRIAIQANRTRELDSAA